MKVFASQEFKMKALEGLLKDEKTVSLYEQDGFTDLCKGPHVEHTGQIGSFSIDRIAGSYWLGDSKNEPLQRVYGLCFATRDELKEYKTMMEEARKRDHREVGKKLDLFSFHEEGPGFVFWHPKGLTLSELSARMELSGASLTRLVQRLERDGMVTRRRMVGDGRSWLIAMEPSGHAALGAFDIHAAAMRQRMFEGISDDDLAAALRVLKILSSKLTHGPDAVSLP